MSRGAVELRGWVPSRTIRTAAGRAALAVPGIESVINSILVRGRGRSPRAGPTAGGRPERMTAPLAPQYDPSADRSAALRLVAGAGPVRARGRPAGARRRAGRALRHPDAAAQRDGGAAHRSRAQQHRPGRPDPLRADARPPRALGAGHRPRRHRDPERGRAAPRQGRTDPLRPRPRGVRRAGVGVRARRPAHGSSSSSRRSAARPTGRAPTSPSTRTSPARCARCSSGSTRRG